MNNASPKGYSLCKRIAVVLLFTCFIARAAAQNFDVAGQDDNAKAGFALARWAKELGYDVGTIHELGESFVITTDRGYKAAAALKVSSGGLDRLIVNVSFKSGSGTKHMDEKVQLANRINNSTNVCSMSIDDEGDFEYTFVLAFDDKLTPGLFRKFLTHVDRALNILADKFSKDFQAVSK